MCSSGRKRALPALVVNCLVGVGLLSVDAAVVLDVLEGVVHEAAVAAVVAVGGRAVHEVLLGERHEVPGLAEVLSLERAGLCTHTHSCTTRYRNVAGFTNTADIVVAVLFHYDGALLNSKQ